MDWKAEWKRMLWGVAGFVLCYLLPVGVPRFDHAVGAVLFSVVVGLCMWGLFRKEKDGARGAFDEGCVGNGSGRRGWQAALFFTCLPLLLVGILISDFLLGRPGEEGVIPSAWVTQAVGGNSLRATFVSAACSALMYFSTCTEVPVLRGLMDAGMGKGRLCWRARR